jgi:putative nucleotidyltransferase with HDIG domain
MSQTPDTPGSLDVPDAPEVRDMRDMRDTREVHVPRRRDPAGDSQPMHPPRAALARATEGHGSTPGAGGTPRATIPRRPEVSWWLGIVLAIGFAALVMPAITAEHWLVSFDQGTIAENREAPFTVRAPMLAGGGRAPVSGGLVVARGEIATRDDAARADAIAAAMPRGLLIYGALFALCFALAALFSHHMRRSTKGRLVRVQVTSLVVVAMVAVVVKIMLLATAMSALVVPVAVLAIVPTMALDRIVGLATGVLAALIVSLLAPFDLGLAMVLLVQAATAGLVVAERPKRRWIAALTAGLATTLCTSAMYLLVSYLSTGRVPSATDPLHAAWLAAALGPTLAAIASVPLLPLYQLLVGEITQGRLFALEDLGHPLLRQIAEKAPGTWQHSLMMANMAEIAANAIGANARLVRVGAYFHDLGKSLQARYFIENLEAGEISPHDQLAPEASCDAIFAHVVEGIACARKARLHERIIDFMHMHHGNGVLEYFWAKCRDQGNPRDLTIERFRYPGHPPQSRETAILAICDAVEAASRTLHKPDAAAIDSLVQRIVYGKLHLAQLDDSGLSMSDLRRISDSLRETIRHANHGRIAYPWQNAGHDASASAVASMSISTAPRLDSLDRRPDGDRGVKPEVRSPDNDHGFASTADLTHAGAAATAPGSGAKARAGTSPLAPEGSASGSDAVPRVEDDAGGASDADRTPRMTARQPAQGSSAVPTVRAATDTGRTPSGRAMRATARGAMPLAAHAPGRPSDQTDTAATLKGRPPGRLPHTPDTSTSPTPAAAAARERVASPATERPRRAATTPPIGSRRPVDTARASGSSPIVEVIQDGEHPTTNLQPLRRGPTGHPPVPSDPAHLAAALASIASRVRDAPFGASAASEDLAPVGTRNPDAADVITSTPLLTGRDTNAAATQPMLASPVVAPAPVPPAPSSPRASSPSPAPRTRSPSPGLRMTDLDSAIVQPPIATPPRARTAEPDAMPQRAAAASPTRAAGLADDQRRPRTPRTLPGQGRPRDPVTIRDHVHVEELTLEPFESPFDPPPAAGSGSVGASERRDRGPRGSRGPQAGSDDGFAQVIMPRTNTGARAERGATDLPDVEARATERMPSAREPGGERPRSQAAPGRPPPDGSPWSAGLASRIDASFTPDEWGNETPIVAPSEAELRALLGRPDPTRQQSAVEIERLQQRAAELADPPRRSLHPTAEVDPDDIEAAIEVAPPARRPSHPNAISARPKKPE